MISKIVFFRYIPLTELISKSHFMDWLLKKGIIVEYLDFSKLFFPNYNFQDTIKKDSVIEINTYSDFKAYLKSQNKKTTLFISIITFERRVYRLFRILTQHNCKLGVFARGMIPAIEPNSISKIKRVLRRLSIKNIMAILKSKAIYFSKKQGWVKPYDIIYLTGEAALPAIGVGFQFDADNADIIDVNTADYDTFLSSSDITPVATNYAVFLDENLTSHPDQKLFNIPPIRSEDYYPELNAFFDETGFDEFSWNEHKFGDDSQNELGARYEELMSTYETSFSNINDKKAQIEENEVKIANEKIAIEAVFEKKVDIEFLELNLLYSNKCTKTFLKNYLYKVGTPEYRKCILNKGVVKKN